MRVSPGSRLRTAAGRVFPFLRTAPRPDRAAATRLRPVRNEAVEWRIDAGGEAELTVPLRRVGARRLLFAWFRMPDSRTVVLDEVGTFVWELCDGKHTIDTIVRKLLAHYKLGRRETEVSVAAYLQSLAERRLIGLYEKETSRR